MRTSMIELLYLPNIYGNIGLKNTNIVIDSIEKFTLESLFSELDAIDQCKILLEQYFLLHYLVFLRGCECSPLLGSYRNYLDLFPNRILFNNTNTPTDRDMVLKAKDVIARVNKLDTLSKWLTNDFINLDMILEYDNQNTSSIFNRSVNTSIIAPIANFFSKREIIPLKDITPQVLTKFILKSTPKLTLNDNYDLVSHPSLSIECHLNTVTQGFNIDSSLNFDYYNIIEKILGKLNNTIVFTKVEDTPTLEAIKFLSGFTVPLVPSAYLFPEYEVSLNASIEPYRLDSWVDFLQYITINGDTPYFKASTKIIGENVIKYTFLLLATVINRIQTNQGTASDQTSIIIQLAHMLGIVQENFKEDEVLKLISTEQYALLEPIPLKQFLHSMVLKYRFLDEEEDEDDLKEPSEVEYTISEKPVTPVVEPDKSEPSESTIKEDDPTTIVDPVKEEEPITTDETQNPPKTEENEEAPLFEFIKEPCTLNELFYKRKVANTIYKLLQTNPKGLVKEQLKALEYWYKKLLFLVDIKSTKNFLKTVLKDYKNLYSKHK